MTAVSVRRGVGHHTPGGTHLASTRSTRRELRVRSPPEGGRLAARGLRPIGRPYVSPVFPARTTLFPVATPGTDVGGFARRESARQQETAHVERPHAPNRGAGRPCRGGRNPGSGDVPGDGAERSALCPGAVPADDVMQRPDPAM